MLDSKDSSAKRTRAFHKRSKLGCLTCRMRRVRCDQTRPACQRCKASGRSCDGYLIATQANTAPIFMKTPSETNLMNNEEYRSLQYFRECTAPQFAGLHEHDFWCQTVLQISASEPCVLHAVIALASLNEAFESEASPTKFEVTPTMQLHRRAGCHYTKAIGLLNTRITSCGWRSLGVSLLCCVLCICFEGLRGSYSDAELHLTHGLNLLKQWASNRKSDPGNSFPSAAEEIIYDSVAAVFNRLAIQASTVTDTPMPWDSYLFTYPEIQTFKDYKTARDSLYSMLGRFYLSTSEASALPSGHHPIVTRIKRTVGLSRWYNCYTRSCSMIRSPFSQDTSSAALLQAIYAAAMIITETDHSDDQMQFDKFHAQFKEVIRCTKIYIASQAPSFSMELGIVSLLHYVVLKCRDPVLRREAIALNDRARREVVWDGRAALRLQQEILSIEEGKGTSIFRAQDVAASSRVARLESKSNLGGRFMTMRFMRQGDQEWSEERILRW